MITSTLHPIYGHATKPDGTLAAKPDCVIAIEGLVLVDGVELDVGFDTYSSLLEICQENQPANVKVTKIGYSWHNEPKCWTCRVKEFEVVG